MAWKTKVIRVGRCVEIRAVATPATEKGRKDPCAVLRFCQDLMLHHQSELSKLVRLWDDIAELGPPKNEEKFKDLPGTDGLYEMKTTKLRVLCFWDDGSLIVCTHGFIKESRKTPKSEILRATQIRNSYFEEKRKGKLQHDPSPRK